MMSNSFQFESHRLVDLSTFARLNPDFVNGLSFGRCLQEADANISRGTCYDIKFSGTPPNNLATSICSNQQGDQWGLSIFKRHPPGWLKEYDANSTEFTNVLRLSGTDLRYPANLPTQAPRGSNPANFRRHICYKIEGSCQLPPELGIRWDGDHGFLYPKQAIPIVDWRDFGLSESFGWGQLDTLLGPPLPTGQSLGNRKVSLEWKPCGTIVKKLEAAADIETEFGEKDRDLMLLLCAVESMTGDEDVFFDRAIALFDKLKGLTCSLANADLDSSEVECLSIAFLRYSSRVRLDENRVEAVWSLIDGLDPKVNLQASNSRLFPLLVTLQPEEPLSCDQQQRVIEELANNGFGHTASSQSARFFASSTRRSIDVIAFSLVPPDEQLLDSRLPLDIDLGDGIKVRFARCCTKFDLESLNNESDSTCDDSQFESTDKRSGDDTFFKLVPRDIDFPRLKVSCSQDVKSRVKASFEQCAGYINGPMPRRCQNRRVGTSPVFCHHHSTQRFEFNDWCLSSAKAEALGQKTPSPQWEWWTELRRTQTSADSSTSTAEKLAASSPK